MKKCLLSIIFLFVPGIFLAAGAGAADLASCREKCISECCNNARCITWEQNQCYSECMKSCDEQPAESQQNRPVVRQ